jgi:hypothetical protein
MLAYNIFVSYDDRCIGICYTTATFIIWANFRVYNCFLSGLSQFCLRTFILFHQLSEEAIDN